MATVIRSWLITGDGLTAIPETPASQLGLLEKDLEAWLVRQPDAIREGLMIIGRQVQTQSGPLDMLGITSEGVLVVIELKRDRPAREALAQAIDYASWIARQPFDELDVLAAEFLHRPLSDAFLAAFGFPLPEVDPSDVGIILVGTRLDASVERMVEFLADRYEMDINALLFRYLRLESGERLLIRTSIVSDDRQAAAEAKHAKFTADALLETARKRGTIEIVQALRRLSEVLKELPSKTYAGSFRYWAPQGMLVGINASGKWNPPLGAIDVWVTPGHWIEASGIAEEDLRSGLASFEIVSEITGTSGLKQIILRIKSVAEADGLVRVLRKWASAERPAEEAY